MLRTGRVCEAAGERALLFTLTSDSAPAVPYPSEARVPLVRLPCPRPSSPDRPRRRDGAARNERTTIMGKKKTTTSLTLANLSERYLAHMEDEGKSPGTCASYAMELKVVRDELGAETLVADLTPQRLAAFNESPRVTMLRSGRPKAKPSIDKTRRVIRLALAWATEAELVGTPTTPRKRKRAEPELAVPQDVATAAADEAEAQLAANAT